MEVTNDVHNKKEDKMTTYTWTDEVMRSNTQCDVDKVADNLMHLKYNSGGLLPVNNLGTITSNLALTLNCASVAEITANVTIALPASGFVSNSENRCILDFSLTSGHTITPPTGVKWSGGLPPSTYSTLSGVRNVLTFTTRDGGATWEAEYKTHGGVITPFVQPILSANGTMGGSSFAVDAINLYAGQFAYQGVDGNITNQIHSTGVDGTPPNRPLDFRWYNPLPLNVTQINLTAISAHPGRIPNDYIIYGSNDYINWVLLASGTNSTVGNISIQIPEANRGFYKYGRLYSVAPVSEQYGYNGFAELQLVATYIVS